jgi:hypothetical protein
MLTGIKKAPPKGEIGSRGSTRGMKEKRKESRIPGEDKIVMRLASASPIYALTGDISPGGVRVLTDVPIAVESDVHLEIVLSGIRKLVHATGRVRWLLRLNEARMCEIGLEFIEIDPEGAGAVLEYVYGRATG